MGHYVTMQVYVTDVYARGVKRGALETDARGYILWRYLLERLTRAWEFRVRDSLGEFVLCGPGRVCTSYTDAWGEFAFNFLPNYTVNIFEHYYNNIQGHC